MSTVQDERVCDRCGQTYTYEVDCRIGSVERVTCCGCDKAELKLKNKIKELKKEIRKMKKLDKKTKDTVVLASINRKDIEEHIVDTYGIAPDDETFNKIHEHTTQQDYIGERRFNHIFDAVINDIYDFLEHTLGWY